MERLKNYKHKMAEPYLYLLPALVFIVAFTYYPFIKTAVTSLYLTNSTGAPVEFVGVENYVKIFKDVTFLRSIRNTFVYVLFQVPITIAIAFCLAMAANMKRKLSGIYEVLFSLPMAVSMSVAALIFKLLLNPQIGALNHVLGLDLLWFNSESTALAAIIFLGVWLGLGLDFIFLLSAVRGVPDDLIESARIDGADFINQVKNIYLPLVSPTIFYLFCTNLAAGMMLSGPVILLTKGGPNNSTTTIIYYMYKKAFETYDYGGAYAASIIGFVLAFVVILIGFRFEKKGVYYS